MNKTIPLTILSILLIIQTAYADTGNNYFGANIGLFLVDEENVNNNKVPHWKAVNLIVKLGHNYNRNFAIEGQLSIAGDDTNVVGGTSATLDKKVGLGIYLRGNYWPGNSKTNIYVLAGLSHTRMDTTLQGSSIPDSSNDLSAGLGIDYYFNENTAISLEGMQVIHGDSYELQTLGIGIVRTF
ncbi:MAG: porin family protein [Gammaproteobacteria bacterium]|nr:porin family protein [Gammaproteobacteria bacterium]